MALGDNEIRLAGQGVGKQLLRLFGQTWNGTTPIPIPINQTNYGNIMWKFGGQDIPEAFNNGSAHAFRTEQLFDSDISSYAGAWCWDFCSENAFRDSVDEATATELRFLLNLTNNVTLAGTPAIEYVQETASIGSAA